ncbi:MAG: apolipoprotein N-acyltransferase [Pseudomonadota bacterium]
MPEGRVAVWYGDRSQTQRMGLAALGGVVAGLGQVPFALVPLAVAGLLALFLMTALSESPRRAAGLGWAFGTGYFALTLHWIVEPFLVDIARHGWMAPFALILLAGGLALFWGLAAGVARAIGGTPLRFALAFPVALALAELVRGYVLTGFPWAMIGYIWTETPALYWSRLVGPYGVTFLTLALVAVAGGVLWRRGLGVGLAIAVATSAAFVLGGAALAPPEQSTENRPIVRLVQPNAPQHQKWDPEFIPVFFRRQLEFSAAPAETPPDLVIWPETAIPWPLERADDALRYISDAAGDRPVALGLLRREGVRAHNAMAVIDGAGAVTALYDKHHLVPFGEYMPLGHIAAWAGINGLAARDGFGYSPGPGPALVGFGALGQALPLICYEAIFPHNITQAPDRPDWIMHITNDAWFGQIAGPYQHLAQARARAVEQGLPVVRVANTGISAMIDAGGRVMDSLPLGAAGFIDAPLPPPGAPTLYSRTGDWPLGIALGLALLVLGGVARSNRD